MRLAVLAIALLCALLAPTIVLALRSDAHPELVVTVLVPPDPDGRNPTLVGRINNVGPDTARWVLVQVRREDPRWGWINTASNWAADIPPGGSTTFSVDTKVEHMGPGQTYSVRVFAGLR